MSLLTLNKGADQVGLAIRPEKKLIIVLAFSKSGSTIVSWKLVISFLNYST
jgi:hypothetical protein